MTSPTNFFKRAYQFYLQVEISLNSISSTKIWINHNVYPHEDYFRRKEKVLCNSFY